MLEGENKEFVSGPGSLNEYLISKSTHAMKKSFEYEKDLKKANSTMKPAIESIVEKNQKEYAKMADAHEALAAGNKKPGLSILKQDIKDIEEGIRFNKKNGNDDYASKQITVLTVLQMLLKDETGVEPRHYGYSSTGNKEAYILPEEVGRNDLVSAALFKTIMAFGSYHPPTSGYYPTPVSVNPEHEINRLFDYDCGLTGEEKVLMINQIKSIKNAITKFAGENFRYRYEESTPRFPDSKMKPHELIKYSKYNKFSGSPNALFYMEDSNLKCRYSRDKDKAEQVFDLAQSNEGLKIEILTKVEELPNELQSKILSLLNSQALKERWKKLAPRTEKPDTIFA